MKRANPTKEQIIQALKEIASKSPDGRVSKRKFQEETGWNLGYWEDRYWPETGYRGACEEANVQPGLILGVETHCLITDAELALRLADMMKNRDQIPPCKRLCALLHMGKSTILREESYAKAKKRIIHAYFDLPAEKRIPIVDERLKRELDKLDDKISPNIIAPIEPVGNRRNQISIPTDYLKAIAEKRGFGEEEQRQLIGRLFRDIFRYPNSRILSEIEQNDMRILDRKHNPWLVIEVKKSLSNDSERQSARRQGFDYAHEHGMRYVVISDGDHYEIYDRFAGERLRYSDMRVGSFLMSSLKSRDHDLLVLLADQA